MAQVSTNEFRPGMKVELDKEPYVITSNEFVKPGKGQPFNRVKLKHLLTGRVVEKTFRSGEKFPLADIEETKMRLLYREGNDFIFMDEKTYEQHSVPITVIGEKEAWCMEDIEYELLFYKGEIVDLTPPNFMELIVTETAPGLRGDSSGRVLKPATLETGAKIKVPIFINEGEKIKVDTRTGEYASRV
ncbi:MAG: Elongation factor P [Chlamydiae bacterium]|nr:Elongation factor P [Chlamydiota bacterium]